jgi:FxsC-like protein
VGPWFFFSYARKDREGASNRLVDFYDRLAAEVAKRTVLPVSESGFFDRRSIDMGEVWDEALREALRTARVLVALCSPSYLASEYCGRELQACLDRVPRGSSKTSILPIIWDLPSTSQHQAFGKYQYTPAGLSDNFYETSGLYRLMGMKLYADDYERFVMSVVDRIVDSGNRYQLSPTAILPQFDQIRNAFAKPPKNSGSGGRNALVSYVAALDDEIPEVLAPRYGPESKEWRPFHPECTDPAGILAQQVVSNQKLYYRDLPLEMDLVKRIEEAEARKEIVILLVDPWSVRIKTYEHLMRAYDKRNFDNSAVLVVWNSPHRQGDTDRKQLRDHLAKTFKYHSGAKKSIYYVDSICSERNFRDALAKTITRLRNSLIESSEPVEIDDPALNAAARRQGIQLEKQPIVAGPGTIQP